MAIALCGVLLGAQPQALAYGTEGRWYVQAGGGANWVSELEATRRVGPAGRPGFPQQASTQYDVGWLAGAAAGYELGNGFRFEIDGAYRSNSLSDFRLVAAGNVVFAGGTGSISSSSIVANALYDIDTGTSMTPYFGFGIGAAHVRTKLLRPGVSRYEATDWGIAVQLTAGVSWELDSNWRVFGQYQYFAVPAVENAAEGSFNPAVSDRLRLDDGYSAHNLSLGVRYMF